MKSNTHVIAILGAAAIGFANIASGAMVDRWTLNEGSGTNVFSDGSLATPMRVLNLDTGSGGNVKWVATPGGTGIQFYGTGGSVLADVQAGSIDQDYGSTFTAQSIEVWIKPDAEALTGYHTLVAKNGDTPGIYLILKDGQPGQYPGPYGTALSANTWYHIVHTADATTERVYINGVEVASGPSDWAAEKDHGADPGRYVNIGAVNYSTEPFKGIIDEVRIYDNALSDAEVLASYHAGPVQIPEPTALTLLGLGALAMRRRDL